MPDTSPATEGRAHVAVLGEVLFDRFPDGPRLGGAPFNVAWHLTGLGLAPDFISRIGADDPGAEIRRAMAAHGMPLGRLQEDPDHPTGQVRITLDGRGGHTFEILKDQAYDHIEREPVLAYLGRHPADLVYFGTLCLRAPTSRDAILSAVSTCGGVRFLDVNLRDGCWTEETVRQALEAATVVKLNEDELAVLGGLFTPAEDPGARAGALCRVFGLDALCITQGETGARWCTGDADREVDSPPTRVVDTVGAGDGFAAVVITGLLSGWHTAETLVRAAGFASAICEMRGACPADPGFYAPYRTEWMGGP